MNVPEILFEDYYILVINKQRGIVTDAANPAQPSVRLQVQQYLENKHSDRKKITVGIPHRIDKPVGGLVVVTKTPQALKHLAGQFEARTVVKKYMGWVEGNIPDTTGELAHWIGRNETGKKAVVSTEEKTGFKHCSLTYNVIKKSGNHTLVDIHLNTGRYHQIRAQLSFIGYPIAGDELYGSSAVMQNIALWSTQLSFEHPKTNERLSFQLETSSILNAF